AAPSTPVEANVESTLSPANRDFFLHPTSLGARVVAAPTRCYARPSPVPPARSASGGGGPQIELTAEGLWSEVSGRLRGALNETTYRTWFDHVEGLELNDDGFVLAVPNDFTRDWIEGHFIGLIGAGGGDAPGHERGVQLSVR